MKLKAEILEINEISKLQKKIMLNLMQKYYLGVEEKEFNKDMADKDKVILLYNDKEICGFSTQKIFEYLPANSSKAINVIFSGDTIIDKEYWGSFTLPIAWVKTMADILQNSSKELYWLLTTKGYKTYRYLPVCFKEYYPCYKKPIPPFEKELIISLGKEMFPNKFNPDTFILKAGENDQKLRSNVAEITSERLKNKDIEFFIRANPNHKNGDELVCITRFHPNNLTNYIKRLLWE